MAALLKILGMTMLVIGFAVTFMVIYVMFVQYFVYWVASGEVAANPDITTLTAPIAFLSCSVPLVMGAILYVGGHALSYMKARQGSESPAVKSRRMRRLRKGASAAGLDSAQVPPEDPTPPQHPSGQN